MYAEKRCNLGDRIGVGSIGFLYCGVARLITRGNYF